MGKNKANLVTHFVYSYEHLFVPNFKYFYLKVIELVINKKRKECLETELEKIGVLFKFYEVQCDDWPFKTQWTRLDGNILYNSYSRIVII